MEMTEKEKVEFEKDTIERDYTFEYQMLSRLEMDCEYYLGYGNKCDKHLWAGNVKDQIEEMKRIYNLLPEGEKPEWLSMVQIKVYERKMNRA